MYVSKPSYLYIIILRYSTSSGQQNVEKNRFGQRGHFAAHFQNELAFHCRHDGHVHLQFYRFLLAGAAQLPGAGRSYRLLSPTNDFRRYRRGHRVGAGSFSARMFGAGKDLEAGQTAGQIFFLSFLFGLGIILLVLLFHDQLIRLFGATEEILPLCRQYLIIISFSSRFLLFSMMSNNLLRAEGRPLLSMYVVLFASVTSAILDPFLIFGLWIFPQLGIKGAAFAAVIAQFGAFLFSVSFFLCLKSSKYKLRRNYCAPNPQIMRAIFSTGFPSIVSTFIINLVLIACNHVLAQYDAWTAIPFSNLLAFILTYYYARREIRRFKSLEISLERYRPSSE